MTEIISDHELLKLIALSKVRKLIQREKRGYQQSLHRRCGVGLTVEEFETIVQRLAANNWVTCTEGRKGGVLITFNEAFSSVVHDSTNSIPA
jgi:hypothetical protein